MVVFPLEMGNGGLVEEDLRLSVPVLGAVDPVPAGSDDELEKVGLAVTPVPVPGMLEVELPLGIGYGAKLDIGVLTAVPVPGMLDVALLVGKGYGAEELAGTFDDELLGRVVEEELGPNVPGDLGTVAPVPPGVDGEDGVEEVIVGVWCEYEGKVYTTEELVLFTTGPTSVEELEDREKVPVRGSPVEEIENDVAVVLAKDTEGK
jgi:hypothetical protein